ncbi:hypothetical protein ACH4OV_25295 [Streptomyces diastaticus]|uniref:hypothetical protein n=1 Tax=Streptomyces diastaticus TaxID=1956 RepID=UPI0037AD9DD3
MTTKPKPAPAATCVAALLVFVASVTLQAWLLMLVVGAVAGLAATPTIGYGTALLFILGANLLVGYARRLFRPSK